MSQRSRSPTRSAARPESGPTDCSTNCGATLTTPTGPLPVACSTIATPGWRKEFLTRRSRGRGSLRTVAPRSPMYTASFVTSPVAVRRNALDATVSSEIRPLEDIASCEIPYWLPPGGRDNGVWADTWELIADLDSDDAATVLGLLAHAATG